MKLSTAICVLALAFGASAQVGSSGIVDPLGNHIQHSHDFAHAFQLVGPSGVVSATGQNIQLTAGQAQLHNNQPAAASHTPAETKVVVGASGYILPDGTPVQLTHDQAFSKVLAGPSGIVFSNGDNVQFRKKRSAPIDWAAFSAKDNLGAGGIVFKDGSLRQLTPAEAEMVVVNGPSGLILKDGRVFQKSADRKKRSAPIDWAAFSAKDNLGAGGVVFKDGSLRQLSAAEADMVVVNGPSGIILKDGRVFQKSADRKRRSAPIDWAAFSAKDNLGAGGIVFKDGSLRQLTPAEAEMVVVNGPSGLILKDGRVFQKSADRKRRSLGPVGVGDIVGPSGIVRLNGPPSQFTAAQADNIAVIGPSGIVNKDGNNVQRTKRAAGDLIGPSGAILKGNQQVQFKKGNAKLILEGPSGYVFSDGTLVQKP